MIRRTSLTYEHGMATVSRFVSRMRPRLVWTGPTTISTHLSRASGHCRTAVSGSPITTNIASMRAAKAIIMIHLVIASRNESSTKILAGSGCASPFLSSTPWLMSHATALVSAIVGSIVAQLIISRYFLCFCTNLGRLAYTAESSSMARRKGSQLDADAVDPKTIAVARK